MSRIKAGQKPVNKPVDGVKARSRYEVDNLIYEIAERRRQMTKRVDEFCQHYATGEHSIRECARLAGYSQRSLSQRGNQLVNDSNVIKLIDCYKRLEYLQNGSPLSWKRQELKKIVESGKAPESAKISAIRLMAEIDGDLRPDLGQGANITVQMNLGRSNGEILEHAPPESLSHIVGGAARGIPHERL